MDNPRASEESLPDDEKATSTHIPDIRKIDTIDTLHQDEALKVLAAYTGDESWTPEEEKKLVRRIDFKVLPLLCLTYGLQYYDKAMLSQAAIFGLRDDLHLTEGNRYSFSAAIFYLGFIVGAYPAMTLAQRFPIERVASALVVVWGICLILTPACFNFKGLFAQRFFLGLLESGISPMFMLIVGGWYKKDEQALRMGVWYCWTGYVSIFSPLINYGLGHIHGALSPWKYMYLFGGSVTIVWGVLVLFLLPPDPIRARGFDSRQRYIAVARLRVNNAGVRNTHYKKSQVIELLGDLKFWLMFFIAFLSMIANGPISTFTPIIINSMGFDTLTSLLLMMPSGLYAGSLMLVAPYLAYRFKNIRSWLVCVCVLMSTVAALLLLLLPFSKTGGLLFACYILPSVGGGYAVLMGLQIANIAGYTKRAVASAGLYIGYCLGNFVGPLVFEEKDAPRYVPGFIVVIVTSFVSSMLVLAYRFVCDRDNKRRDAAGTMEAFDNAYQDDLTDMTNPEFRYIL
ncbi:MFS general substrate transporter [Aspergillus taichungensis]|uniref:MFS general substrate transporter n=1 Tax=Aspergillus taichungensis TaxID=482145 RepID=A0A2J5HME0_9EURO|nr:MFS general substrate transporter [Aspergillus taichungensis]